ncbi:MAG: septation regulator SpoVG [Bacilli bacterium]|nr:septation regulator SpoVG [Bacilli bacterium]
MEITNVKVFKTNGEDTKMKGYATVTLDDCFVIRNLRIIQGEERLFVAMPSRKKADGEYEDIVHPTNAETRKMFEDKIIEEYNNQAE